MSTQRTTTSDVPDWNQLQPFEIGALIIAVLAFPGANEGVIRKRAFEALCADYVREKCRAYPEEAAEWRAKFPTYAAIDAGESRRRLRTLARRLRDRMMAARMALRYFGEALKHMFLSVGQTYPDLLPELEGVELWNIELPEEISRHSLNDLCAYSYPHSGEEARHNREQRTWRQSLRVIHLAVAFYVLARHWQFETEFAYDLTTINLHRRVLQLAEVHEMAAYSERDRRTAGLKGSSTFQIDPTKLIRFRTGKSAVFGF